MIKNNFLYNGVDVDYDREYHCEEFGCDDICRCSTIIYPNLSKIDCNLIIREIYDSFFGKKLSDKRESKLNKILYDITDSIQYYTIDRICRYYKIWDKDFWDIKITNGYYGQEIGSVELKKLPEILKKIEAALEINSLKQRIDFLLNLEYGYILPILEKKEYKLETIERSDIIIGNETHYKKVKIFDDYSDLKYNSIICVVIKDNNKYRLIDGYHRLSSTKKQKVLAIVAS